MTVLSIRFGTNDIGRARTFYDATFAALGIDKSATPETLPMILYAMGNGVRFLVGGTRDGQPATYANGGTVIFAAQDEDAVRGWHSAGIAHGGTCEGPPQAKPQARGAFGAYLRDPDGNKIAAYYGL